MKQMRIMTTLLLRSVSGLGWSLKDQMDYEYFGLRTCIRNLLDLHVEIEGLLWAASYIRDRRITSIRFETNCSDLVDMTTNPVNWRLRENFEDVNLAHIPRTRNGQEDALTKETRIIGYIFFSYKSDPFISNCFGKRNWSKQSCMPYLENDEHVLIGRTALEVWTGLRQLEFDEFFRVSFIPCTTWVDDPIDQTRVKQLEGVKTKFVVVAQANKWSFKGMKRKWNRLHSILQGNRTCY
ncbi:hypothetical protein F2Q69_00002882 [Brassica cretica]|uniref:RNase H type-1 domain-containing protein n=1 Tax=Brassica cretica TaxID=69181 RepID=A0A8S9NUE9_BRACR|nr:hypothetical protein F2Q69_00002882 [Brassica cretica]